jgi:hypothetical protein
MRIGAPFFAGGARAEAQVRPSELSEQGRRLEACIHAAADALVAGAPQLNEMDAKVGGRGGEQDG